MAEDGLRMINRGVVIGGKAFRQEFDAYLNVAPEIFIVAQIEQ